MNWLHTCMMDPVNQVTPASMRSELGLTKTLDLFQKNCSKT